MARNRLTGVLTGLGADSAIMGNQIEALQHKDVGYEFTFQTGGETYDARIVNTGAPVGVRVEPDPLGEHDYRHGNIEDGELRLRVIEVEEMEIQRSGFESAGKIAL